MQPTWQMDPFLLKAGPVSPHYVKKGNYCGHSDLYSVLHDG